MRVPAISLSMMLAMSAAAAAQRQEFDVELVLPGIISTGMYELPPTFSRDGGTALWSVSTPSYGRWLAILEATRHNGKWSKPKVASFSGKWIDADPFFTPDGSRLFFLSRRPLVRDAAQSESGYRIWYVDKAKNGWGTPVALPAHINNSDMHYVAPVSSGALYIAGIRADSKNQADIYYVPFENGAWLEPRNLGPIVNGADHWDTTPYVAPDESYLIFASRGRQGAVGELDLYISLRTSEGWSAPRALPQPINTRLREFCPIVSPDGEWLYFSSDRGFVGDAVPKPQTYAEMQRLLHSPGNGLGDVYRVRMSTVLEWARRN